MEETTYDIGGSGLSFRATGIGDLGATEYTLGAAAVDLTSSTTDFADDLRDMLIASVRACARSPRSDNLMFRGTTFSSYLGVHELFGFRPLPEIDPDAHPDLYPAFHPRGLTNLCDATLDSVGAAVTYGADLTKNDFLVNSILFIITDGGENSSTATMADIGRAVADARQAENLESIITILVGVNTADCRKVLERFQREAGIDKFVYAGDATPARLAKLAEFIEFSVSSQSQALGTGGPSKAIPAPI